MNDKRILKTYVWHGEQCFFVSTIERDSSASGYLDRYNETIVWSYDWASAARDEHFIFQGASVRGSIALHQRVVQYLFDNGTPPPQD